MTNLSALPPAPRPARPGFANIAGIAVVTLALMAAGHATAQETGALLPSGRRLTPVGTLAATPNFPTAVVALGDTLAVLGNGAGPAQTIRLFAAGDLAARDGLDARRAAPRAAAPGAAVLPRAANTTDARAQRDTVLPQQNLFQGMAAAADGTLYVTGGASDNLLALRRRDGKLQVARRYALQWQPFPGTQYPYQYAGDRSQPRHFYPDSVVLGPGGVHAYVSGLLANSLARVDLASGAIDYLNVGAYPFAVTLADNGARLVVSDWGGNGVTVIDRAAWRVAGHVATGPAFVADNAGGAHPTALAAEPGSAIVWVADSNLDRVVAVDVHRLRVVRSIDDAPYPGAPPGSVPDALAIAGGRLFVANAGNDDVAVYALRDGRRLGLIPTGWYPSALAVADGALYVTAAKGLGSGPNLRHQWVGTMMHGLLQRVDLAALPGALTAWTAAALHDNGFGDAQRAARARDNATATRWLHAHIRHVIFILRENKTFDEDFGRYAAAGAWADPKLDLYGPRELPNLYALAARGALFVNFDADGEVTSQGHQWTTAGVDSDFVQRTWPQYYSGRGLVANSGWTQALDPEAAGARNPFAIYRNLSALGHWSNPWISYPARLFLFNDLLAHRVSFEDFGEFASRSRLGAISPALRAHLAVDYPAWDRLILDTQRAAIADRWIRAHAGHLPRVLYLWLPDDHTAGATPCYLTPDAYVADNDRATADVIHTLSMLPAWKHTLVLVTEDDAQSGADHIDAHRTLAVAAGPWVRPGALVTARTSQVDLLRTIEAVADVPPMSQWDAGARVLGGLWRAHPDFAIVPVLPRAVALTRNPGRCPADSPLRGYPVAPGHALAVAGVARYTPVTLLKVPGPVQMRESWLASRGAAAYAAMLAHVRDLATQQQRPVSSLIAGDDGD